jgi:hypothetical protein
VQRARFDVRGIDAETTEPFPEAARSELVEDARDADVGRDGEQLRDAE